MIKFISLLIILTSVVSAQIKSNFDLISVLTEKSVAEIVTENNLTGRAAYLETDTPNEYRILVNVVINTLNKNGVEILNNPSEADLILNYSITKAGIRYTNPHRDGLFGENILEREYFLEGTFYLSDSNKIVKTEEFSRSGKGTLKYDNIDNAETPGFGFTKSDLPGEDLFLNLTEPVIAVSTVILLIVLLFSVRS